MRLGSWEEFIIALDRDKEAIELYEKVIELNPDFYAAYNDLSTKL